MDTFQEVQVVATAHTVAANQNTRIRELARLIGTSWVQLGIECLDFRNNDRWRDLGFASLDDWREDVGIGRSTFYAAMRTVERLQDVPRQELEKMTKENAEILTLLPESKRRDPEIIEQAQTLRAHEFEPVVKAQLTGAALPEKTLRRVFMLPASLAERLDRAMAVSGFVTECESTEVKLEAIIETFMQSPWEGDESGTVSNEQAFARIQEGEGENPECSFSE